MESLYLLIPVALIFCVICIRLLIWAINSGQYDDLDKEAWRILADEPPEDTHKTPQPEDKP
jgi:cbb3-type cytochrome oxidase maturation protein